MGIRIALVVFVSAALAGGCANAQEVSVDAARAAVAACLDSAGPTLAEREACADVYLSPCMEQPGGDTTYGMIACTGAEYEAWDEILNDRYGQLREAWPEGAFEALREAQGAWLAWREAECDIETAMFEGGTLARVTRAMCMNTMTAERAVKLDDMLSWLP